jgi:hypothetical protein
VAVEQEMMETNPCSAEEAEAVVKLNLDNPLLYKLILYP